MKAKTVKEVLIATRWIIENVGWFQGNYVLYNKTLDRPAAFCVVGALLRVEVDDDLIIDNDIKSLAMQVIHPLLDEFSTSSFAQNVLARWNDKPGRSKEEVLTLLDQAIERADKL